MQDCVCSDGRTGKANVCPGQPAPACDCSSCQAFQPGAPPAFTACGGEPFGIWFSDTVLAPASIKVGGNACMFSGATLTTASNARVLLLDLESGGTAALSLIPPEIDYALQAKCAGLDPLAGQCGVLHADNGMLTCTDDGCGVCRCATKAQPTVFGSLRYLSAKWARSDSTLTVSDFNTTFTASYCVQGDSMTLQDSAGVVYNMARGYVGGTPTACSTRSAATCVDGCSLGQCQGGASCTAAASKDSCLTTQGCSWSDTTCVGTPPKECDWTSTDPGCLVAAYRAECAGAVPACGTYAQAACASAAGCTPKNECLGGAVNCAAVSRATCDSTVGCARVVTDCIDITPPNMNPRCSDQTSNAVCTGAGCSWTECTGTAEPCQVFSGAECSSHAGCYPAPADAGALADAASD